MSPFSDRRTKPLFDFELECFIGQTVQLFFALSDTTKPQAGPVALYNSDRMFFIQFEEGTHSVCSAGRFITKIGRENT
ncbi:hypothetical protein HORM4_510014 [Vibrio harveyi]|nr:hypothetical protein HORM4_510014 [Vibrio harveyi]